MRPPLVGYYLLNVSNITQLYGLYGVKCKKFIDETPRRENRVFYLNVTWLKLRPLI